MGGGVQHAETGELAQLPPLPAGKNVLSLQFKH